MIEYRRAKETDIEELKNIWSQSFGDTKEFIDFYFANRFRPEAVSLLINGGEIASMLTKIPVNLATPHGVFTGTMFYAIATHPQYQRKGFSTRLTDYVNQELLEEGQSFSVVVPANSSLFNFYGKQGYEIGFSNRSVLITKEELLKLKGIEVKKVPLKPITPELYNQFRRKFLAGRSFLDYQEGEILYQKNLARFSGTDLYSFIPEAENSPWGLLAVEKIDVKRLIIKEALLEEEYLPGVLRALFAILEGDEALLRMPSFLGKNLKGNLHSFAMHKNLGANQGVVGKENYLGLAFD